jgi:hypothetical protein
LEKSYIVLESSWDCMSIVVVAAAAADLDSTTAPVAAVVETC